MSYNFCFIGAGNLATHLSTALKKSGNPVIQVYSRTEESAETMARKLDCEYTTVPGKVTAEADVYIIALKDSAFDVVLPQIKFTDKLLVHCSGSMPLDVLEKYSANTGVVYPLQTFSKQRALNFGEIPVFVEANSEENEEILLRLAREISNSVSVMNSQKRIYLHIAAVFACNFANYFYTVASDILEMEQIPFDVLQPLIQETADKVQEMLPADAQTGPAVRFDENVITKHLAELEGKKGYDQLYNIISKRIFEHHQKNQ